MAYMEFFYKTLPWVLLGPSFSEIHWEVQGRADTKWAQSTLLSGLPGVTGVGIMTENWAFTKGEGKHRLIWEEQQHTLFGSYTTGKGAVELRN